MTKKSNVQRSAGRVLMLAVLLSAGWTTAVADDYMPFVQEGKQWNYVDLDGNPFSYVIEGDTAINGKVYKKVYYQKDAERKNHCAVREEDRLVYAIAEGLSEEKILCIFDLLEQKGNKYVQPLTGSTYWIEYTVGRYYPVRSFTGRIHHIFTSSRIITNGHRYISGANMWYEGVGDVDCRNIFPDSESFYPGDFLNCYVNGECIFTADDTENHILDYFDKQCATPTIAYDKGRLVFSCETEGAECVYEIKCTDTDSGRGSEVSLSQTYEIRVYATLDGHYDSDVATATIGWRNGRPVMEGFSSVTLGDGEGSGDVNGDGSVDVADISAVIAVMAGQEGSRQAE